MVKVRDHNYEFISVRPFAPNLGAEVYGVDLSKSISEEQFADIYKAFLLSFTINHDRKTSYSKLGFEHVSPVFAKELLTNLVKEVNNKVKER